MRPSKSTDSVDVHAGLWCCCAGTVVRAGERDIDFETIVGQHRLLRPARTAALEVDDADVFEFGEIAVDLFVVAIDRVGRSADALGLRFGDRFEQFQILRTEISEGSKLRRHEGPGIATLLVPYLRN